MKNINKTKTSKTTIKEVNTKENCPFIKKTNKRYGFKIKQLIVICDELKLKKLGWQNVDVFNLKIVPQNCVQNSQVDTIDLTNFSFDSLDEFYQMTNTGYYSYNHILNKELNNSKSIISLIPVIQIHYKRKTYSFQLNNRFVEQFFEDTLLLMSYPLSDEERSIIDKRFLEHKEYLEYFFHTKNCESYSKWWIDVFYHKLISNNNNMLHSEHIERHKTIQDGILYETIPFSISVNSL